MSSYRRFISYMYDYHNGQKRKNCGFIKVEIKNNRCIIFFQLKNVSCQEKCNVYLYYQGHEPQYVFLQEVPVKNGMVNYKMDISSVHMTPQCKGLLCTDEKGNDCGTCWEGEGLPEYRPGASGMGEKLPAKPANEAIRESVTKSKSITEIVKKSEHEPIIEAIKETGKKPMIEVVEEIATEPTIDTAKGTGAEAIIETTEESASESVIETTEESASESVIETTEESASESVIETAEGSAFESITAAAEITEHKSFIETSEETKREAENTANKPQERDSTNSSQPRTFSELWEHMQKEFPTLEPFEDHALVETIKIAPSDLGYLQACGLNVGTNQFLLHGYQTYNHLLLGRIHGQMRYILGIPGIYDSQEQFMAKTFGFPCFKPIRECRQKNGQFGYWLRCFR